MAALRISLAQRCALASRAVLLIEKKVVFAAVKLHSTRPPPLLGAMTRARSYYDAGLLYAAWSAWIKSAEVSRLHTRLGELACLMDMENSLQRGCTRLGGHIEMCVERSLMGELADAWSSRHRSDRGFGVWVEWVNSKWAEKRRGPEVGQAWQAMHLHWGIQAFRRRQREASARRAMSETVQWKAKCRGVDGWVARLNERALTEQTVDQGRRMSEMCSCRRIFLSWVAEATVAGREREALAASTFHRFSHLAGLVLLGLSRLVSRRRKKRSHSEALVRWQRRSKSRWGISRLRVATRVQKLWDEDMLRLRAMCIHMLRRRSFRAWASQLLLLEEERDALAKKHGRQVPFPITSTSHPPTLQIPLPLHSSQGSTRELALLVTSHQAAPLV